MVHACRYSLVCSGIFLFAPVVANSEPTVEDPSAPADVEPDSNSCIEGTIAGGLIGAGIGGVATGGNARWIGVPGGAVGGSLLGYQIDGG